MVANRWGKVGEGFVPEARRGTVRKYVKCKRRERECEQLVPISWSFFSFFFFL